MSNFRKLNIKKENKFRILQVGTIAIYKGVLTLIESFKNAKIKNSELIFVGPKVGGKVFPKLLNKLSKDEEIFFYKSLNKERLNKLYNSASVLVMASLGEGFGLVVAEAMAVGLPVIVTENTGAADLIIHGKNGFVVKNDSPDEIEHYLKLLYKDIELRKFIGENARKTIKKNNSNYGDSMVKILHNVIS